MPEIDEDSPVSRWLKNGNKDVSDAPSETSRESSLTPDEQRSLRELRLQVVSIVVKKDDAGLSRKLRELEFRLTDFPNLEPSARQAELDLMKIKLEGIKTQQRKEKEQQEKMESEQIAQQQAEQKVNDILWGALGFVTLTLAIVFGALPMAGVLSFGYSQLTANLIAGGGMILGGLFFLSIGVVTKKK